MTDYDPFANQYAQETVKTFNFSSEKEKGNFVSKVFGVMFLWLLVTAALSYGFAYAFVMFVNNSVDIGIDLYLGAMVVSAIGTLVLSFVLPIALLRSKHSILGYCILYILFMSVLLSTIYLTFDLSTILLTFVATSAVFGIMGLLGYLSKGSLSSTWTMIIGLFFGAIILSLFNIFFANSTLDYIVSFAMLAVILLITMYDVRRIKDIAQSGINSKNLVSYCAFMIYLDFINVFLRLLAYIARFTRKN